MVIMYKEMNAYIVGCHKNDGNDDYLLYYYGNGISLTSSAPIYTNNMTHLILCIIGIIIRNKRISIIRLSLPLMILDHSR